MLTLLIACLLPVPVLIAADAPVASWGLWGAGYIAAALGFTRADKSRDLPGRGTLADDWLALICRLSFGTPKGSAGVPPASPETILIGSRLF